MARRITGGLVATTLGCILVLLALAWPARASEPNPYHYWSTERLTSEGRWSHVCDLRGDDLLWSEISLDSPSEIWLLDISSGARSLIFQSELPVLDLWEPAPYAKVWGDYVAYASIGPDAAGPYYADYELFLVRIRPEGEGVRLSQRDGVTISELEIDDGYVAWVEEQEDRSDLYLYCIETKEVEQLASADSPELHLCAMREGRVAWTKGASLYLYGIASSTNVLVAQGADYVTLARISGNRLAWDQDGALWLRDLSTETTAKVADDLGGFDLSAERLVWSTFEYLEGDGGVQGDIYLKEFPEGVVTRLTNDDELDLPPQVSDHWVVWLRGNVKGGELTAYDLATGRTSTVAPYAYGFCLDGDRIGWYEYRSKGDVFLARALRFSDVDWDQPFFAAIEDLAQRGIIAGFSDGTFRPSDPLTRQQFAKMIVKTLGLTVIGNESCPFADVGTGMDLNDPFYPDKYVAVCALNGITQGKTPTAFAPYANITRAQLLSMVVRAATQMGLMDDPSPAYYLGTSDGSHFFRTWDDPDHARNAQAAEFNGLLEGIVMDDSSSLSWDPYKTATRGEVAQILWRLWQKMGSSSEGREIRIGFVTPLTGSLAIYGVADWYCVERWREAVGDGLLLGDGKKHRVTFMVMDSQSDSNRAAQVAGDLINNAKVDMMMVASMPETVNPVADQCEYLGVPCISTDAPWQNYFFGRGATKNEPFKWTYHYSWGLEDIIDVYTAMWSQVPTNKVVGVMWPNDPNGITFADRTVGFPSVLPRLGYTIIDPGRYQDGSEDFTAQIAHFKQESVEIVNGVMSPPDFRNFWAQSVQQGFTPKIATVSQALRFPQMLEALGDIGVGLTTEVSWSPAFPFQSSLTSETSQQLADDFEARTGVQWEQDLMHYALGEIAIDVLERARGLISKQSILEALKTTKLDTIAGPVDFTSPVAEGTLHPVPNVYKSPLAGGQWVEGTKWPYDLVIVNNAAAPMVPVQGEIQPLQ